MRNKRLLSLSFLRQNLPHLLQHEAFRANPLKIVFRGVLWVFASLFRDELIFRFDRYGSRIRVVPNERRVGASSAFIFRDNAEPELKELEKLTRVGDVFLDCGANIGAFTIKAASIVGETGRVITIEPGKESVNRLRENISLNTFNNIVIINKAASDKIGMTRLYHSGDGPVAYSLIEQSGVDFEDVEMSTLDAIVVGENVPTVDCIKIDVEGAEATVLNGAKELLTRWKPTIIFEINSTGTRRSGGSPMAAWDILLSYGYSFFLMQNQKILPLKEYPSVSGNIVAIGRRDRLILE